MEEKPMKRVALCVTAGVILALATLAFAQVGQGLSGPHYNLNIIGVPQDKTVPDMTGSNRHTIFVPLQSGGDIGRNVKIFYIAGEQFEVLDGNATDDNEATIMVPSEPLGDLCYKRIRLRSREAIRERHRDRRVYDRWIDRFLR
jgi:hypothetical protein